MSQLVERGHGRATRACRVRGEAPALANGAGGKFERVVSAGESKEAGHAGWDWLDLLAHARERGGVPDYSLQACRLGVQESETFSCSAPMETRERPRRSATDESCLLAGLSCLA